MCPATNYWQNTIGDVVDTLCGPHNSFATDGVYIDQIAAAGPRPCWDPTHGHPVGGGSHWVEGYQVCMGMLTVSSFFVSVIPHNNCFLPLRHRQC